MAGHLSKRGAQDRARINVNEAAEVRCRTEKFTVSEAVLRTWRSPLSAYPCKQWRSVQEIGPELFQPHVLYQSGLANVEQIALPRDCDPYATAAEARRHTEQQAMRWVHDRTGDGQGQF